MKKYIVLVFLFVGINSFAQLPFIINNNMWLKGYAAMPGIGKLTTLPDSIVGYKNGRLQRFNTSLLSSLGGTNYWKYTTTFLEPIDATKTVRNIVGDLQSIYSENNSATEYTAKFKNANGSAGRFQGTQYGLVTEGTAADAWLKNGTLVFQANGTGGSWGAITIKSPNMDIMCESYTLTLPDCYPPADGYAIIGHVDGTLDWAQIPPVVGAGDFIQNQIVGDQTADFRILGTGLITGRLEVIGNSGYAAIKAQHTGNSNFAFHAFSDWNGVDANTSGGIAGVFQSRRTYPNTQIVYLANAPGEMFLTCAYGGNYFYARDNGDLQLSGRIEMGGSTTARSSMNVPHGTAPTSPVDGDVWTTSLGIYVRINGVTVGPLAAAGGASWGAITGTLSAQTDLNTELGLKLNKAAPQFTGTITTDTVYVNTITGGAVAIDWNNGNTQAITLNNNITSMTMTKPPGNAALHLYLNHANNTTDYTIVWPTSVQWPNASNTAPTTYGTIANGRFLVSFGWYAGYYHASPAPAQYVK